MAEDFVADDEDHWCDYENSAANVGGIQGIELKFESFVAKISVGIPVGAYYLNRKVMCTVSLLGFQPNLTKSTGLSGYLVEARLPRRSACLPLRTERRR